jgi:SOS response regulatory protein OraA/RecX
MTDEYRSALGHALKRLATSDRFEAEIRGELERAGHEGATIESVISSLRDRKILDDERTIISLAERRSGRRSVGMEKIRAELLRRGAPEELVEDWAQAQSEGEADRMRQALAGKFPNGGSRDRAARFLLSRGFPEDGIEDALDELFAREPLPD